MPQRKEDAWVRHERAGRALEASGRAAWRWALALSILLSAISGSCRSSAASSEHIGSFHHSEVVESAGASIGGVRLCYRGDVHLEWRQTWGSWGNEKNS